MNSNAFEKPNTPEPSSERVSQIFADIANSKIELAVMRAHCKIMTEQTEANNTNLICLQGDIREVEDRLLALEEESKKNTAIHVFVPLRELGLHLNGDDPEEFQIQVQQVDFSVLKSILISSDVEEQLDLLNGLSQGYLAIIRNRNMSGDAAIYSAFKSGLVGVCSALLQSTDDVNVQSEIYQQFNSCFSDSIKIDDQQMKEVVTSFKELSIEDMSDDQVLSLIKNGQTSIMNRLLQFAPDEFQVSASTAIDRILENPHGDRLRRVAQMHLGKLGEIFDKKVAERLMPYSLTLKDFFGESDEQGRYTSGIKTEIDIVQALRSVQRIEAQHEGAAKRLLDTYGIKEFYRYPEALLLKQLEDESEDTSFGVLMYGRWEGGGRATFDSNAHIIQELADNISESHTVKIFEFESARDIAKHLIMLKRMNSEHLADFVIIGDHGSPDSTSSGIEQSAVLEGFGHARIREYLADDAQIILQSCSTGAVNGLAESISDRLELIVYAPESDSSVISFGATSDNGELHFSATYEDAARHLQDFKKFNPHNSDD